MADIDVELELRRLGGIDGAILLLRRHRPPGGGGGGGGGGAGIDDEVQARRIELGAALLACVVGLDTAHTPPAAPAAATAGAAVAGCGCSGGGAAATATAQQAQCGATTTVVSSTEQECSAAKLRSSAGHGKAGCTAVAAAFWEQRALWSALQALQGARRLCARRTGMQGVSFSLVASSSPDECVYRCYCMCSN